MYALILTVNYVLGLYEWVVIAAVIMSWLVGYGVVNRYNQVARMVGDVLYALTEPVLRPIRRIVPSIGGIDLSPLILLILIYCARAFLMVDVLRLLGGVY